MGTIFEQLHMVYWMEVVRLAGTWLLYKASAGAVRSQEYIQPGEVSTAAAELFPPSKVLKITVEFVPSSEIEPR